MGVNVPDLGAAVELFRTAFGLEVTWESTLADEHGDGMSRWLGLHPETSVRFAFLESRDERVQLELLEWSSSTSDDNTASLAAVGMGHHIALWVDDMADVVGALCNAGCRVFDTHPVGFVYVRTPWGLYLQLMPEQRQADTPRTPR